MSQTAMGNFCFSLHSCGFIARAFYPGDTVLHESIVLLIMRQSSLLVQIAALTLQAKLPAFKLFVYHLGRHHISRRGTSRHD